MKTNHSFDSLLEEELNEIRARDLYRQCRTLEQAKGTRAFFNGREVILFCGNDYLGLSQHPSVVQAATKTVAAYGIGSGASRLISGTSGPHAALEEEIARFKKKPRALVYTAGYLANLGVLSALANEKDVIVMDKLSHASLIDGARLSGAGLRVFPHKNYGRCEEIMVRSKGARRIFIVSDTVFSMDGDLADLPELIRLKEKYEACLIVDDAHGTGVLGQNGHGAAEGFEDKIDLITGTLSKALGTLGGFAAASETMIDYLINFSRPFIFATSMPPALCSAALEALRVVQAEPGLRTKLWNNVRLMHTLLKNAGFALPEPESPILPLVIGEEKEAVRISAALLERGILIPAVRTPSVPKGKARLRITLSAGHDAGDIQQAAGVIADLAGSAKKILLNPVG